MRHASIITTFVLICVSVYISPAFAAGEETIKNNAQLFSKPSDNTIRRQKMSYIHSKREFVVGHPAVFDEARQVLAKRSQESKAPLVIKTPIDKTKLVITSEATTDYDINGDGFNDLLEGVSYRMGYGLKEYPYQWANFTKIYFGSPDKKFEQNTSYETTGVPDMVDAGFTNYQPSISNFETGALHMIEIGTQSDFFDKNVAAAVHAVMTFGFNFNECLYFIKRNDMSRSAEVSAYIDDLENNLGKTFLFALEAVKRQIQLEPDKKYSQRLKNIQRNVESNDLVLPGFSRVGELWYATDDKISGMVPDDLNKKLIALSEFEKDPKGTAEKLRKIALRIQHQKQNGGLFDGSESGFVTEANRYAKEQGYENYAAFKLDKAHGLDYKQYVRQAHRFLRDQSPYYKSIVGKFKEKAKPGRPVWQANIFSFFEERRKEELKKLGFDDEPKLTAADVVKALRAFYNDLGWNTDAVIVGGDLVLDLYPRDKKTTSSWHESMADGKRSIVIVSLGDKNGLDEVRKGLIHEMGHAFHAYYASNNAGGSYFGGVRSGKYGLKETIPTSFEGVVFSKEWMDKYLSEAKGFEDPKVREVLSRGYGDQLAFWRAIQVMRTLWEINLYANADQSMEQRLNYWGELCRKYLGLDDIGVPSSQVSYANINYESNYVHPAYEPMYYVSYVAGADFGKEMTAHALLTALEKDKDKKQQMSERLKTFFEQSMVVGNVEEALTIWSSLK